MGLGTGDEKQANLRKVLAVKLLFFRFTGKVLSQEFPVNIFHPVHVYALFFFIQEFIAILEILYDNKITDKVSHL